MLVETRLLCRSRVASAIPSSRRERVGTAGCYRRPAGAVLPGVPVSRCLRDPVIPSQVRRDRRPVPASLGSDAPSPNSLCGVRCSSQPPNTKGRQWRPSVFGGDEEDRTPDLRIANATLSQLSYVPTAARCSRGSEILAELADANNRARFNGHRCRPHEVYRPISITLSRARTALVQLLTSPSHCPPPKTLFTRPLKFKK